MSSARPTKQRHRASIACASCRLRRTKCVIGPGQNSCDQCRRSGLECVVRDDDERRRPTSKAYMNSLTERIELLETLLQQTGQTPPPANHPPATNSGLPYKKGMSKSRSRPRPSFDGFSQGSLSNRSNESGDESSDCTKYNSLPFNADHTESSSYTPSISERAKRLATHHFSTSGQLSSDRSSVGLRYSDPTENSNIFSDLSLSTTLSESRGRAKRMERIVRDLSSDTQDYLMDLFWTYYNSVLHVVHKDAFCEDKEGRRGQSYSGFLHICLLAMGFRFADTTREDMQKLNLGHRESTLHREAKHLFEYEVEQSGGVSSVQALLILGDLEYGVGRENTGWMYGGMACRLCFDIGLNLHSTHLGLSEHGVQIRHMVLWACMVYDKYWALFLGRPTSIKSSDLRVFQLTAHFQRLGSCLPSGPEKSLETLIYEALLDLMDVAGKITEDLDTRPLPTDNNAYLAMAALDRELNSWYMRLPGSLKWSPTNVQTAPFSFFLLHQQFHSALILLHRPFATYEHSYPKIEDESDIDINHFSLLSRSICFDNATRLARIFRFHRERFDTRQIFVTGLHHAGTAATALVAGITLIQDPKDRVEPLQHLQCLDDALQDMSHAYAPAERLSNILSNVMRESAWKLDQVPEMEPRPARPSIPARRASSNDAPLSPSYAKKRHVLQASTLSPIEDQAVHESRPQPHRSESLASLNQRNGFGLDSMASTSTSAPRSKTMPWKNGNPTHDPVFFANEREILGLADVGIDGPYGGLDDLSAFGGPLVEGAHRFSNSGQQKLPDPENGPPDLWGDILRQMGA
ncbi:MAG: hypothetical protein M1827_004667 [Pycnora praestabilis]|nr:MAG: hypothetical protein M1827_004667 [Pycnora praestabilis]